MTATAQFRGCRDMRDDDCFELAGDIAARVVEGVRAGRAGRWDGPASALAAGRSAAILQFVKRIDAAAIDHREDGINRSRDASPEGPPPMRAGAAHQAL